MDKVAQVTTITIVYIEYTCINMINRSPYLNHTKVTSQYSVNITTVNSTVAVTILTHSVTALYLNSIVL